jgi:hypothetical protein
VGAGLFVVAIVSVFGGGQSVKESPATPEYQAPTSAPDSPSATTKRPAGPKPTPTAGHLRFVDIGQARQVLPGLPVKGRAPLTDYSREAFGTAWSDTNDNGCDTRNDILRRDLRDTQVEDCVVMSGVLDDPYSGRTIGFTRGPVSSLDVQIDHVVALANAWQTGAAYWSPGKREQFANDRRNLLAVDGALNMQKSDGDAATWLPPRKSFRCAYVSMQVLAKQRYGLWVTAAEKAAMQRVLDRC